MIGKTLAHYEITEKIGEGGMGVVYLARDTQLAREVALKLLPAAFADDTYRLARFRREAQTLAALQHPNIASIYGIETVDPHTFLVMEYCEGEDLSEIIARGPMAHDDIRSITSQIAAGLEEAHLKGVVHRDLKPANVKVTSEGKVKILDFGLARTFEDDPTTEEASNLTMTVPVAMTQPGTVLGTATYMSPEQARGKDVDKRTDIWAFGVILWETLTEDKLFAGETVSDILASVLRKELAWDDLPPDLPPAFNYLLRRCLERDRDKRLRDIGEARCLLADHTSVSSLSMMSASLDAVDSPGSRGRSWLWPVMAVIAFLAAGFFWWTGRGAGGVAQPADYPVKFTQLTTAEGREGYGDVSADGKFVVYSADQDGEVDIYLQRVGGLNPINLTASLPGIAFLPALSPDGENIVFTRIEDGVGLHVMGATGESVKMLAENGSYGAWSPDGKSIVYGTEWFVHPAGREGTSHLTIIDADGSNPRVISGEMDALQPDWSPGGHRIAFWSVLAETGQRDIWTIRPDGTDLKPVTQDSPLDFCPVWSRDGHWLMFLSIRGGTSNVWRVRIDEQTGEVRGQPEPFTLASPNVRHFSMAPDGKQLVYESLSIADHLYQAGFDPEQRKLTEVPRPLLAGSLRIDSINLSPDNETLVFRRHGLHEDLVTVNADGTGLRLLTDDAPRDRGPSWYRGSDRLIFYSDRSGKYEIWSIRRDGSDLKQLSDNQGGSGWFPEVADSLGLVATFNDQGTFLMKMDPDTDLLGEPKALPRLPDTGHPFWGSTWSSDGKKLIGWSGPTINHIPATLTVWDHATGTYSLLAEIEDPWNPLWLPDGSGILFEGESGLELVDLNTKEVSTLIAEEDIPEIGGTAISTNGTMLYIMVSRVDGDLWMADLPQD